MSKHEFPHLNIPSSKKHAGSTSAEPKEGKCGNEFIYTPIGRNATTTSVSCAVNGKSSPSLEANKTYINEREKIEESQQGSVDITVDGKKVTAIDELAKYKKHITTHKDVKVAITLIDKEWLVPAREAPIQIPEFRSPDQQATMTGEELAKSEILHQEYVQSANSILQTLGIREEEQAFVVEAESLAKSKIAKNVVVDIMDLSFEEQKNILHELLTTFKFDALALPTALAFGDLLSGTEKAIIADRIRGIKDKGWNGKFSIKISKTGKILLVFKGWATARKYLNFTMISASDKRVTAIGAAAMASKLSSKALSDSANVFKNGPIGLVVVGSFEILEWGTGDDPFNNWSDLFIGLGMGTVKLAISTAGGLISGGIAVGVSIAMFGVASVGVVIVSILLGGIAVSIALEAIDGSMYEEGLTQKAKDTWNEIEHDIEENAKRRIHPSGAPKWLMR